MIALSLILIIVSPGTFLSKDEGLVIYPPTKRIVIDSRENTIYFLDRGFFSNSKYYVKYSNNRWRWKAEDDNWIYMQSPCVYEWNEINHLVLESSGRIFVSRKDNKGIFEVKMIDEEWNVSVDEEWIPLSDMYVY